MVVEGFALFEGFGSHVDGLGTISRMEEVNG